ncbi:c-type cytochrome [Psychrobacter sp. 1U2]|uniref:c-type cytochrome n=1 Tax=Psychrobacter sp. 1U2 TaxID=3453577 RepID=UPI003F6E1A88
MDIITMKNRTPKMLTVTLIAAMSLALTACSQNEEAETIASKQDAVTAIDNQASRNNGAWGGVYMTREELAAPPTNIVDQSSLPVMEDDPELAKWQAKFEIVDPVTREQQTNAFVTTDGKKLYHDSCAGCHMHDGKGAYGAGYYPPLADNEKMESKYYTIGILINGFRGMPSFHMMMNNEQMAAVTQYVMNDLNDYKAEVTAADVEQLRHANPPGYDPSE